jgi:hypothetical protein
MFDDEPIMYYIKYKWYVVFIYGINIHDIADRHFLLFFKLKLK